ncbi:nucleoside phosphorylase [Candidatus Leptofilum sp.]|uniref:nucleoside phosphorylase n=1 Tax=Candidatus Leptofilum sp. TaxID=3241576 RepID=UPI003B5AC0D4
MSYPNYPIDFDASPILTAALRLQNQKLPSAPTWLIFCPQASLLKHAVKRWRGKPVAGFFGETYLLAKSKNRVAVAGKFGVGAPVVAVLVEEFAVWGAANFVLLGVAGGLQPTLQTGDLVLADTAVRDEGTSHHYLPPAKTVAASTKLSAKLETAVHTAELSCHTGTTWTTDALYRETAVAVQHYQKIGVQTVEMEAAALFAVAQHCQVEASALLAVSDSLAHGVWQPAKEPHVATIQLIRAFDAIVQTATEAGE